MKEKIIARLKQKFSGLNLSKARMDAIADKLSTKITDENEIDGKLDELNELVSFEQIAKDDDKIRTLEAKDKQKPTPKPQPKPKDKADDDTETPDFETEFAEMKRKLYQFEQQQNGEKLTTALHKKLNEKKIPLSFAKGRVIEKEEDIDTLVAEVEADFGEVRKQFINEGLSQNTNPILPGGTPNKVQTDIKEWAAAQASEKK